MRDSLLHYEYEAQGYDVVAPHRLFGRSSVLESGYVQESDGYRAVTAEEFFGGESEVIFSVDATPHIPTLSGEPLFQILVVATLVVYLYMILRSWNFIGAIWGGTFARKSERSMVSEGGMLPMQRFKQVAALLGSVTLALMLVRLAEGVLQPTSHIYSDGIASFAPVVGLLLVVVCVAWSYALHKVVEWVTYSDAASSLSAIGYMNFVRCVTLLYPIAAVWMLAPEGSFEQVTILLVVCSALMILLYLKDTFLFFIEKKISILYFILYLCTAILLPLSFFARLLPDKLV